LLQNVPALSSVRSLTSTLELARSSPSASDAKALSGAAASTTASDSDKNLRMMDFTICLLAENALNW